MKHLVLLMGIILIAGACRKTQSPAEIPVNKEMKAAFDYKPGSYWIYRDSVTGFTDSAYVISNTVESRQKGCAFAANLPYFETITISIFVADNNATDSEHWNIMLCDSTFTLSVNNNKDAIESSLILQPFTYPFKQGNSSVINGCLLYMDSANVVDIEPVLVNSISYNNTANLNHISRDGTVAYNDCFYTSADAGFVKVVFDHPAADVHRVLELQRYKLVR